VLCASLSSSAAIIYVTITPFLYQHVLKLTPVAFGWVTAVIAIGIAFGNILNALVIKKFSLLATMKVGLVLMFLGVLTMLMIGLFHVLNLWVVLCPMLVIVIGIGLVGVNAASSAMTPFPKIAGTAAAIYGGLQMLIFAVLSAVAAILHTQNQIPLACLLLLPPIIIALSMKLVAEEKISLNH
jgi:MFS family permease